jgi:hypothetical protein
MTITISTPDFHIADVMRFYRGTESNMFLRPQLARSGPAAAASGFRVSAWHAKGLDEHGVRGAKVVAV